MDTLSTAHFVVPQEFCELRGAAERLNKIGIGHGAHYKRGVYAKVNTAFLNNLLSAAHNSRMHPSTKRLLDYAKAATADTDSPIRDFADLGARLGVSSAVLTNWKERGVSKDGAIAAEEAFGGLAHWILRGGKQPPAKDNDEIVRKLVATDSAFTVEHRFRAQVIHVAEWLQQFSRDQVATLHAFLLTVGPAVSDEQVRAGFARARQQRQQPEDASQATLAGVARMTPADRSALKPAATKADERQKRGQK